ncbi:MAG: hypothetical protein R3C44_09670 [Chloroflexota bacterium]
MKTATAVPAGSYSQPMDGQSDVVGTYVTGFEPVAGDALSGCRIAPDC